MSDDTPRPAPAAALLLAWARTKGRTIAIAPPGPAIAALLRGAAHVHRQRPGARGATTVVEHMVGLNRLRELDALLGHAIAEVATALILPQPRVGSSVRCRLRGLGPVYALSDGEDALLASLETFRERSSRRAPRAADGLRRRAGTVPDATASRATAMLRDATTLSSAIGERLALLVAGADTPPR